MWYVLCNFFPPCDMGDLMDLEITQPDTHTTRLNEHHLRFLMSTPASPLLTPTAILKSPAPAYPAATVYRMSASETAVDSPEGLTAEDENLRTPPAPIPTIRYDALGFETAGGQVSGVARRLEE